MNVILFHIRVGMSIDLMMDGLVKDLMPYMHYALAGFMLLLSY